MMKPEELEERLIETDEVKGVRDIITCAICFQIITEDRRPMECNSCRNQLFCSPCIESWSKQKKQCPCCRKDWAKYSPANNIIMRILSNIKFTCANKKYGCEESLFYKDVIRHESFECQFKKQIQRQVDYRASKRAKICKICNNNVETAEDVFGEELKEGDKVLHICSKNEKGLWCSKHRDVASYYSEDRIVNLKENEGLANSLKCQLCQNLFRTPVSCKGCGANFCRVCIANELLINDQCPACEEANPTFKKLPRNVTQILNKFLIRCKNEECDVVLDHEKLQDHERVCTKCLKCRVKCSKCNRIYRHNNKKVHECPPPEPPKQEMPEVMEQDAGVLEQLINNIQDLERIPNINQNRVPYCEGVKDKIEDAVSKNCNYKFTLVWITLDVLQLYFLYFVLGYYQINEFKRRNITKRVYYLNEYNIDENGFMNKTMKHIVMCNEAGVYCICNNSHALYVYTSADFPIYQTEK